MDDGGHRENGRNKPDIYKSTQSQWLMQHQPSMKQLMSIMAERDAAIQERNMALNDKNKALEERDLAIMQRNTAIQERNDAVMERDNALAALQDRENIMNSNNPSCPPGCQISRGVKHVHHPQQHLQHQPQPYLGVESTFDPRKAAAVEAVPLPTDANKNLKTQKVKRPKEPKPVSPNKTSSKPLKKVKREGDDPSNMVPANSQEEWKGVNEIGREEEYKQFVSPKSDWKKQDLGLNQVAFDDSTMPPPVCSCTGVYRQCYKWGNGGWQSACCTTTMSMYPLPAVPNKRHARVGGRKMSGGAFSKLLSRLSNEGHDLSVPVDLKDHWAKHGTNRYITIR